MPKPTDLNATVDLLRKSGLIPEDRLRSFLSGVKVGPLVDLTPDALLGQLVDRGMLTNFQAAQLRQGRHNGFRLGQYRILDRLGVGGMGQVYLAEHTGLNRRVAIKVLRPTTARTAPMARERFVREASVAALLDHPNIVRVFDVNMEAEPPYLVMEFVDGKSLQAVVQRSGRFTVAEAAVCGWQVANGLHYAHQAGLVHRDIKPANLLIDASGRTRILDLGIVRVNGEQFTALTSEQLILGTVEYLSPEQAMDSSTVDGRADVYSLGATLYYLLTERTLYGEGSQRAKMLRLMSSQHEPIVQHRPDLPRAFAAVIDRMLERDPADRYSSAGEAADALAPWAVPPADFPRRFWAADGTPPLPGPDIRTPSGLRPVHPITPIAPLTPTAGIASTVTPSPSSDRTSGMHTGWTDAASTATEMTLRTSIAEVEAEAQAEAVRTREHKLSMRTDVVQSTNRSLRYAMCGGILVLLIGGFTLWALLQTPATAPEPPRGGPGKHQRPRPNTRWVSRTSTGPNIHASLADAFRAAKAGETIEIRDDHWAERVVLDDTLPAVDVTLTATHKGSRLRSPDGSAPVVSVTGNHKLRLHGLTIDGQNRSNPVVLHQNTPGPVWDDVTIIGVCHTGFQGLACSTTEAPMRFRGCRFVCDNKAHSAVHFDPLPNGRDIRTPTVADCRFEGGFAQGVLVAATVFDLTIEGNRFHGPKTGLVFGISGGLPLSVTADVTRNTFAGMSRGLHFWHVPVLPVSRVRLGGNLFQGVTDVGGVHGLNPDANATKHAAVWARPDQTPTDAYTARFRTTFDRPADAAKAPIVLNLHAGQEFSVWLNGQPVAANTTCDGVVRTLVLDTARTGKNLLAIAASVPSAADLDRPRLVARILQSDAQVLRSSNDDAWVANTTPATVGKWFDEIAPSEAGWLPTAPLRTADGQGVFPRLCWATAFDDRSGGTWVVDNGNNASVGHMETALPVSVRKLTGLPPDFLPTDPTKPTRFLRYDASVLPPALRDRFGVPLSTD